MRAPSRRGLFGLLAGAAALPYVKTPVADYGGWRDAVHADFFQPRIPTHVYRIVGNVWTKVEEVEWPLSDTPE